MIYCPYCAERLSKPFEVCPNCKKVLDMQALKQIYGTGKSSRINKRALRKLWFKEHGHIIAPLVTLIIGLAAGTILSYAYANVQFQDTRVDYESRISALQTAIEQKESTVGNVSENFEKQLQEKETIISILTEQKDILGRIIYFTNILTQNSRVLPDSTTHAEYFRRNVLYLGKQFEEQQEKLQTTGYSPVKDYNLKPIPQLLEQ